MTVHDGMLSAFLDGEATQAQRRAVKAALGESLEVRERLGALARADTAIASATSDIDRTPLPAAVTRLLESGRAEIRIRPGLLHRARFQSRLPSAGWWAAAATAAFALVFGAGLGAAIVGETGGASVAAIAGTVNPGDPLHAVLESAPSGRARRLGDGLGATPILTAASEGVWCREVVLTAAASVTRALACREGGAWRVVAATAEAPTPSSGAYAPAGRDGAFEAIVAGQNLGTALDADEERELIDRSWARAPAPAGR